MIMRLQHSTTMIHNDIVQFNDDTIDDNASRNDQLRSHTHQLSTFASESDYDLRLCIIVNEILDHCSCQQSITFEYVFDRLSHVRHSIEAIDAAKDELLREFVQQQPIDCAQNASNEDGLHFVFNCRLIHVVFDDLCENEVVVHADTVSGHHHAVVDNDPIILVTNQQDQPSTSSSDVDDRDFKLCLMLDELLSQCPNATFEQIFDRLSLVGESDETITATKEQILIEFGANQQIETAENVKDKTGIMLKHYNKLSIFLADVDDSKIFITECSFFII